VNDKVELIVSEQAHASLLVLFASWPNNRLQEQENMN
jgi:hypothetical protein